MSELIDNRVKRIHRIKNIVRKLHEGVDAEVVRHQMAELVSEADAGEIAAAEEELIAEGTPVEEIRRMCDLHAAVVRDVLSHPQVDVPPGHPVDTLRRENEAICGAVKEMREAIAQIKALPPGAPPGEALLRWRQAANHLMDVDKHYRRKEDLFFSHLEKHGITGPSKVMWAYHDGVRSLLKTLQAALGAEHKTAGDCLAAAEGVAETALAKIAGMVDKEENIFVPMTLNAFTEEDWTEIWRQSPRYGWCLVEPRAGFRPSETVHPDKTVDLPREGAVQFPSGTLTAQQLLGIFATLPVDITFVDANDRVRFFTEGERIFARTRAIIGRKVQHCHPPKSVGVVDRILSDFRSGRQNVAEFWINFQGRFVHIRYFAVREAAGEYLGTLEVTQDLTRLRALQGERRLLQYETGHAV